jgi:hypothetical protein
MADQKDPKYLDDAFAIELEEMLKTFIKKNKDYGKGNILDNGELGIIFRINDKVRRIQNLLMKGETPENESIEDNWQDIAVYAVIGLLLKNGKFENLDLNPEK